MALRNHRSGPGRVNRDPAFALRALDPDHDFYARIGKKIHAARLHQCLTLAQLGDGQVSRSFLSAVEHGRTRISLRVLAVIAARLQLPISHFLDECHEETLRTVPIDLAEAALAYSRLLQSYGETQRALEYALWAAESTIFCDPRSNVSH